MGCLFKPCHSKKALRATGNHCWKAVSVMYVLRILRRSFMEMIMSIPYFIVKPEERERALNVVGTQVTVLASNSSTLARQR
jgi:hypothetical protein